MPDPSPLTRFFLQLAERRKLLQSQDGRAFATGGEDNELISAEALFDDLRAGAADLQVWLEMQGRSEDASEIDDATASLRETIWKFDHDELQPYLGPDERDDVLSETDQLIEALDEAIGRLEDLDGEIPDDVWRGYDDA